MSRGPEDGDFHDDSFPHERLERQFGIGIEEYGRELLGRLARHEARYVIPPLGEPEFDAATFHASVLSWEDFVGVPFGPPPVEGDLGLVLDFSGGPPDRWHVSMLLWTAGEQLTDPVLELNLTIESHDGEFVVGVTEIGPR